MKLLVERNELQIIPEGELDEAFIEEILGLKKTGSQCYATRVAPIGLDHALAYIRIKKQEERDGGKD